MVATDVVIRASGFSTSPTAFGSSHRTSSCDRDTKGGAFSPLSRVPGGHDVPRHQNGHTRVSIQIRPVGGAVGCLVMILVSILLSVALTVLLNLIL